MTRYPMYLSLVLAVAACKGETSARPVDAASTACPAGEVQCGTKCADPMTDRAYCGASGACTGAAAGTVCAAGQVCSAGTCALSCQAGLVDCGGTCVDPLSSRAHCGVDAACSGGAACGSGEVCASGACATSCPAGQVDCAGKCADPTTDRAYCGASGACTGAAAGTVCAAGQVCSAGTCALSCQAGLVDCGGTCVDPLSSRTHCGVDAACSGGAVCGSGEVCASGACSTSCPPGEYACGGRCIDPASDPIFCGAAPDCSGGRACGTAAFCSQGACWAPCSAGLAFCGATCVDPLTSTTHCGASGLCTGAAAGAACRADQVCSTGTCACPPGRIDCGGTCVDPLSDASFCGASGSCTGTSAGTVCAAGDVCGGGVCVTRPDFDWRPAGLLTRPPHFVEGPSTLAHIVFDGTNMVDTTGHTHWTAVGAPATQTDGMWSPPQSASGPFSASTYWIGDAATKAWLDANTAGDFTICARYKPGVHPGMGPNKVIMANGKPEAPGTAGWALMQMHEAACFHYHDTTANGEWMSPNVWPVDDSVMAPLEWTWQCGGRIGAHLTSLREGSVLIDALPVNGQIGPLGPYQVSADLPTIGSYADGTSPLLDGWIYEILVTSDVPGATTVQDLVARASGGLRQLNEAPLLVAGADGLNHDGPPSTLVVQADGTVLANQDVELGATIASDPTVTGECFGLTATASDWNALTAASYPLAWQSAAADARTYVFWNGPATTNCFNVSNTAFGGAYACGTPPALAPGSTHTFLYCLSAADGYMRIYADGSTTPFAVSVSTVPVALLPRLDDRTSSFHLGPVSSTLRVSRVFACGTADPAICR